MIILVLLVLLLWAGPADAKNLCVNASTGSDANTYASNTASGTDGSGTSCWATVYRAARGVAPGGGADVGAQAAAAGDTVYVAAGTYSQPGEGTRFAVALNPANSGSAGNYITFQCGSTAACTLTLSSGQGPVIGANGKSYIKWVGFLIDEQNAQPKEDTGPAVCNGSDHVWFERLRLIGYQYGHNRGDNHPGIRLEACDSAEVRNNTISGFYACPSGSAPCVGDVPVNVANGNGIQFYESDDALIENNTIYDSGAGIFIKGPDGVPSLRPTLRKNLIYNCNLAIALGAVTDARIYQNAGYGISDHAVKWWTLTATATPTGSWFINNTFVMTGGATAAQVGLYDTSASSSGNRHENNVYSGGTYGNYGDSGGSQPRYASADYNVHYNWSSQFAVYSGGNQTLAAWRTAWSIDASTVTTNPSLVSGTDLRLCTGAGTPAVGCAGASGVLTLGVDRLDLDGDSSTVDNIPAGAYVLGTETIGVSAEGSSGVARRFRFVGQ